MACKIWAHVPSPTRHRSTLLLPASWLYITKNVSYSHTRSVRIEEWLFEALIPEVYEKIEPRSVCLFLNVFVKILVFGVLVYFGFWLNDALFYTVRE